MEVEKLHEAQLCAMCCDELQGLAAAGDGVQPR
jgi:hypothetical protein